MGLASTKSGDIGARFLNTSLAAAREALTPGDKRFDHTNAGVTAAMRFVIGGLPVDVTAADVRSLMGKWQWPVVPLFKSRTRLGDASWTVGAG